MAPPKTKRRRAPAAADLELVPAPAPRVRRKPGKRAAAAARVPVASAGLEPLGPEHDGVVADDENTIGRAEMPAAAPEEVELLSEARDRWLAAYSKDEENILAAYEDLKFLVGGMDQWDEQAVQLRVTEERPIITVNMLPQFVDQVTGDLRQSRPAMKSIPVDSRGDPKTAEVIGGLFRYIENRSAARAAYFAAGDSQVGAGIGHWRVATDYSDQATLNQEIRIVPLGDQISVLWDPDALEQSRCDADYCFVPVDKSRPSFRKQFPDARDSALPGTSEHQAYEGWYTEDYVRVAEYFFKRPVMRTLLARPDGSVDDLTGKDPAEIDAARAQAEADGGRVVEREGKELWRALITCDQVLEKPARWPGQHIPIIRVQGKEITIGRRTVRHGVIRHARDPQRLVNYYESQQAEVVALQPKAPFIGTAKNFETREAEWSRANTDTAAYLAYEPDPINAGKPPQRATPPQASAGVALALENAKRNIQGVIGIYDANLGKEGQEKSGRAILARQKEGDTGTYVYVENFGQAIAWCATVVLDLIPHVYDTERTIRIVGMDGKENTVDINKPAGFAFDPDTGSIVEHVLHDVTVGAYDVVMQMGPSFASRRQEAIDGMTALLQASPDLAPLVIDLLARDQDWPSADEIAERVEATLPYPIQVMLAKKRGTEPPQPPADPAAQTAELQAQIEQQKIAAGQAKAASDEKLAQLKIMLAEIQVEAAKVKAEAPVAGAPGAPAAEGGVEAPRVAALERAVQDIAGVLQGVVDALQGEGSPPAPPAPGGPPGGPAAAPGGPPVLGPA